MPTITIRLPSTLAGYCDGQREQPVDGVTAETAIADLTCRFPELAPRVLEGGRLLVHLMVMRNGTGLGAEAVAHEPLVEGDVLTLLFLAGGG